MIELLGSIKGLLKPTKTTIDNWVFFLHSKVTFILFLAFTIIISGKQYIGDPIDCLVDEIPNDVMDAYCWIYSTFTVNDQFTARLGKDVAHAGVGPHVAGEDKITYHKYYQWVGFVLFFQAILFYLPRYIWKNIEKNRVQKLVAFLGSPYNLDLGEEQQIIPNESSESTGEKEPLVKSKKVQTEKVCELCKNKERIFDVCNICNVKICQCQEGKCHYDEVVNFIKRKDNRYYYWFQFCMILNLLNVIGQIFLIDQFLDGEFTTYGFDAFKFLDVDPDQRYDPLARVFPKVTKCTFHKYGPSGTVQKFEGICVLPVNILNEKIYFILWFWLVILSAITGLFLIYEIRNVSRQYRLDKLLGVLKNDKITIYNTPGLDESCKSLDVGDWFLMTLIGGNADHKHFKLLIQHMQDPRDRH